MSFNGKVVLVTGGTSGIGRETAIQFSKAGANVVLAGRRTEQGEAVAAEINDGGDAQFVQTDVTQEDQVRRLVEETVERYGRLDIAFNNAGIEHGGPVTEFTEEDYRKVFDINVLGVFLSQKYEIPAMLKSGGGVIINTSSILGRIAMPGAAVYNGTRCGRHHQDNGTRTRRAGYPSEFRCSGRYRNTHDRPFRRRRGHRSSAATCFATPDGSSGRAQGNCRGGPLSGLRRSIFHDRNLVDGRKIQE